MMLDHAAEDDYRAVGAGTFLSRARFVCVRRNGAESLSTLPWTTLLVCSTGAAKTRLGCAGSTGGLIHA